MNITPDNFSSVSKQLILTNTDLFIDLISDPQYFSYHNQKLIDDCFILACEANNLDIVKYLLHPHTGSYTANIHYDDDCGLRKASYHVYLEIVDYLLSSPELITHANIHSRNEACLEWACEEGRLELVQYLTTSPKLKEHANVNAQNGIALTGAINSSHSDVALFLLTDDKLKNTINPFIDNHAPFFTACDVNCQPLIDYYLDLYQTTPELITELISDAAFAKFEDHTPTIKIVWNLLLNQNYEQHVKQFFEYAINSNYPTLLHSLLYEFKVPLNNDMQQYAKPDHLQYKIYASKALKESLDSNLPEKQKRTSIAKI